MNSEKDTISGWLYVYTLFLIALIVSPFVSIVSFFSATPLILLPLYITSLVLIYRRSKYAISVNKITLLISIFFKIFTLYMLFNSHSEAPEFIFGIALTLNTAIIVIMCLFLAYLQKSKQIKNISTDPTEKTVFSPAGVQVNNQLNPGHLVILYIVSMVSCGIFIFTGWGFLFFIPASLVFSIFYSVIFTRTLVKNNASAFAVYSVTLTLLCAYTSLLLNMGMIGDSPNVGYLAPSLLGVNGTSFTAEFNQLLNISFLYLLFSIPLNILFIIKSARKIIFFFFPLIGLILIAIHWGIVWVQLPELKAQATKEQQEAQRIKIASVEEGYNFNWSKINKDTFQNRIYSIFTPPAPLAGIPISECPYTTGMIEQNLTQGGFNIHCLNDVLKPIGQVPITRTEGSEFSIPNWLNMLKKGDTVVVVAELGNPSLIRINANGNAAKDCACRMAPYDYADINEYIKTGTSTGIYERSVIQMQVTDKKRTVMVLYPINTNNLKDIDIKISQFSDNPHVPVTLSEVAVLSPTVQPPDPEWLKKWSKEPNPFLNIK